MSQLVQTIWFNTSSALSGAVSMKPSLECLQKVEGCLKVMHGFQAENKNRAVIIIFWRSFPGYTDWTQQDYPSFISLLPISIANSLEIQMVDFRVDPSEAFSCPITEIATMKFQEGSTKQQMDAVFHSFMDLRPKISKELDQSGDNCPKYFAWGEVEDVPYTYSFSLGWDSLEHHRNIGKRYAKEAGKHVDNLTLATEVDIRHAELTSY